MTKIHPRDGPSGSRDLQPSKTRQSIRPVPPPHSTASSGHPSVVRSAASSPNESHKSPVSSSVVSGSPSPRNRGRGKRSLPYTLKRFNGMKIFECKTCKKKFSCESKLNRHILVHTGERPFSCRVCGKSFNQSSTLKSHQLVHMGEKPSSVEVEGNDLVKTNSKILVATQFTNFCAQQEWSSRRRK